MSLPLRQSTARETRPPSFVQAPAPTAVAPAAVLHAALAADRVAIPPRFFYDELGSRLFTVITALDEYYPTRTEAGLLREHLPAIAAAAPVVGNTLVDLGAGDCRKAAALFPVVRPQRYVAVDVSVDFLRDALGELQRHHPQVEMVGVGTDFSQQLQLPDAVPPGRRLFFYPGSSIGNFTPREAVPFLRSVRDQMHGDGVLWIGVDLQKDAAILEPAYDDALGVTAAFNRNVLRHANRLAGTDFDVADWRHVAFYDPREGRIEMHLEALRDLVVTWPGGRRRFVAGERIHTENSYKYTVAGFAQVLADAGLRSVGCWTDPRRWFGFFVAVPA
ncbi:MAG: L-histidine N(alpha)-methyltransferase [Planctomycetes bacterium]|nr:L-histidine N(alpha)-methyltransferase [Planctomycetota bacterium]